MDNGEFELGFVLAQWSRLRDRVLEMRSSLLAAERAQTRDAGPSSDVALTELATQLAAERASFDALARQIDERIEEARRACEALARSAAG
jgi:hypothetical protein